MALTDKGMNGSEAAVAAVSVAIVEDHPEFRDALSAAVRDCPGVELLPVCRDLPAAVSLLERVCPDVLLIDLGLPSGSGLQLFHMVHAKAGVRCASAVLTVTGNEEHLLTTIVAGDLPPLASRSCMGLGCSRWARDWWRTWTLRRRPCPCSWPER
jgi:CheY-like chemotaxis protein